MQPVSREQIKEIVARALQEMISNDATVRAVITSLSSPPQTKSSPADYIAPWTGQAYAAHPSQQQFSIGESTQSAGADELLDLIETRLCTMEKNKPCDQCGLCRSLGF